MIDFLNNALLAHAGRIPVLIKLEAVTGYAPVVLIAADATGIVVERGDGQLECHTWRPIDALVLSSQPAR